MGEYKISDFIRILDRAMKELGDVKLEVRTKLKDGKTVDGGYPNEFLSYFPSDKTGGIAYLALIAVREDE